MDKRVKKKMLIIIGAAILFAIAISLSEKRAARVSSIERNTYGRGSKTGKYEVTVGKSLKKEPIDVEIGEREYTAQEIRGVFKQTMDKLEKQVLGRNKSADHVEYDLNLITRMPGVPLEIEWESNRSNIINSLGEIQEENITGKGELVQLKGFLKYGEEECLYVLNVRVYPKTLSRKEKLVKNIEDLTAHSEEKSREKPFVSLPKEIDGEPIIWEKKTEHQAVYVVVLGGVLAMLVYQQEKEKKNKKQKEREKQMELDYPEIVSQISLLAGAGITVKNAWKKIVTNYQENKPVKGVRYAYEEMAYTIREMQGGISEPDSYEHFGKRCKSSKYMKLGALLSQNVRKGTKGLVKLLDDEAQQALEEKKQMAKRRGEETSTKLLLPMSMMLVVVLIVVIVPAFLSIRL